MTIEYLPPGLENAAVHPYSKKMLQHRDGYALVVDQSSGQAQGLAEGSILSVVQVAREYSQQNPEKIVRVIENSCGLGSPEINYLLRL